MSINVFRVPFVINQHEDRSASLSVVLNHRNHVTLVPVHRTCVSVASWLGAWAFVPPLSFFEATQTEQLRLQFPLNDATIQAGRCWRSVAAAFHFPTLDVVFS